MKKAMLLAGLWIMVMAATTAAKDHRDPGEQRFAVPAKMDIISIPMAGTVYIPEIVPSLTQDGISMPLSVTGSDRISILTGPDSPARTHERWNIAGADLGFTFEYDDKLYMVFGDTWGRDGVEGADWRSNVMVVVEQDDEHGYIITDVIADENGEAKEILPSLKEPRQEYTVIPNTGVSVGDRMYLQYMSVRTWDKQWWGYKKPIINHSSIAWSDDGGQTWNMDKQVVWEGSTPFAQGSMVKHDGYVYFFGATADRFGPAHLLRVDEEELLNPEEYKYWAGDGWSEDPYAVQEIIPGPVGEMSVRWSEYHRRWIMMYKNENSHNVVMRTAPNPEGPWDYERVVASSAEYKTLYAPMLLPIEDERIMFAMSVFLPTYQVYLMEVRLR